MDKISIAVPIKCTDSELITKISLETGINRNNLHFRIVKKSIDARKKNDIRYNYTLEVDNKPIVLPAIEFPKAKNIGDNPIIVGCGPSGLFAGLMLARSGMRPIIIERGADIDNRSKACDEFFLTGLLDINNNIQFGEGGAGTFSDGKLNTGVKSPYKDMILRIFVECGAPQEICYINKPHIGTDRLREVIKALRHMIIEAGGEIIYNTRAKVLIKDNKAKGVIIGDNIIESDTVILAIGHSARDTYKELYDMGVLMEQKAFACGLRIEHLSSMIDKVQYGNSSKLLPTADYKLVSHIKNLGSVYTFCMCPGGIVVPASSEKDMVVVNGMSNYLREGKNSNSALLTPITDKMLKSDDVFAGIEYQRKLERQAYRLGGGGYKAPVQRVDSFMNGTLMKKCGEVVPSYPIGYEFSRLDRLFNQEVTTLLRMGIDDMANKIPKFNMGDAILTGVESRSTSPVRIIRDERYMSVSTTGLYPIGEGCGYAGGIMSASIDGVKVALSIIAEA